MKIYCSTKSRKVFTSSVRYGSGHRVTRSFFEVDCAERVTQRRCTFCFRFQVLDRREKGKVTREKIFKLL